MPDPEGRSETPPCTCSQCMTRLERASYEIRALTRRLTGDASRCDLYGSGKHSFLGGAGCICGATDDASA